MAAARNVSQSVRRGEVGMINGKATMTIQTQVTVGGCPVFRYSTRVKTVEMLRHIRIS